MSIRKNGEALAKLLGVDTKSLKYSAEDLAQKETQRLQRAQDMGFGGDTLYHASQQDIHEFEPGYEDGLTFLTPQSKFANDWLGKGKFRERQGGEGAKDALYEAQKTWRADYYNEFARKKGYKDFDDLFNNDEDLAGKVYDNLYKDKAKAFPVDQNDLGKTVYPVKSNVKNTFDPEKDIRVMDDYINSVKGTNKELPRSVFEQGHYMAYETPDVVNYLKDKGYDSVHLRESTIGGNELKPYTTLAVFNPKNIRSTNAQFDPKKVDFRNLLASTAAGTGILTSMGIGQDTQAGFLPEGIKGFERLLKTNILDPKNAHKPTSIKNATNKYERLMNDVPAFRWQEELSASNGHADEFTPEELGKIKQLDPSSLTGNNVIIPFKTDQSDIGQITMADGIPTDVMSEGGSRFTHKNSYDPNDPIVWGSNYGIMNTMKKKADRAYEETGRNPIGMTAMMGREAVNFSTPVAENLLRQTLGNPHITQQDKDFFDNIMKKKYPDWHGIDDPRSMGRIKNILNDGSPERPGAERKAFANIFNQQKIIERGFPSYNGAIDAANNPGFDNFDIGDMGSSVFNIEPNAPLSEMGDRHWTYNTGLKGEGRGELAELVPMKYMMPDEWAKQELRLSSPKDPVKNPPRPLKELEKMNGIADGSRGWQETTNEWEDGIGNWKEKAIKEGTRSGSKLGLAGAALMGIVSQEEEAQASFIGKMSKLWDTKSAKLGQDMYDQGKGRDEIWEATGGIGRPTRLDVDGHWKQETDDSALKYRQGAYDQLMDFPEGYFDSKDLVKGNPVGSSYDDLYTGPDAISVEPTGENMTNGDWMKLDTDDVMEGRKEIFAHEQQHGIQTREGFAKGGDIMGYDKVIEMSDMYDEQNFNWSRHWDKASTPEQKERIRKAWDGDTKIFEDMFPAAKRYNDMVADHDDLGVGEMRKDVKEELAQYVDEGVYRRLSGEAEARNVETRLPMTMDERKKNPPWNTLDELESELVTRGVRLAGGTAGSALLGGTAQADEMSHYEAPFLNAPRDALLSGLQKGLQAYDYVNEGAKYLMPKDTFNSYSTDAWTETARKGGHAMNSMYSAVRGDQHSVANAMRSNNIDTGADMLAANPMTWLSGVKDADDADFFKTAGLFKDLAVEKAFEYLQGVWD